MSITRALTRFDRNVAALGGLDLADMDRWPLPRRCDRGVDSHGLVERQALACVCGQPAPTDTASVQRSLRILVTTMATGGADGGAYRTQAKAARRTLRARRGHPARGLCLYCRIRFSWGRDAAEAFL